MYKHTFDKTILRSYDIRGIYGKTLTDEDAFMLGFFFGTTVRKKNPDKKQDTCISSIERTRSEFCAVAKKQISLTTIALKEKTSKIIKNYPKEIATSLLTTTKETSLIENIAKKSVIYNRR